MNKSPQLIDNDSVLAAAGLVHRVWQPETPGPHPVVVMLHGHLGNEDVMWVFAQTVPSPCVMVAPRAIVPAADDHQTGKSFTWLPRVENEWPIWAQFNEAVTAVTTFIHALPSLYQVDLNQVYLMGFSQGAAVAFATALHAPGWIKGIASLVGFVPLQVEKAIDRAALRDVPVFMAAGTQDERVPLPVSQSSAAAVQAMGAFLEYREYDTGHKLDTAGMRKLKNWWAERLIGD
ncbi:MAG: dienelactone hydrolase family protein [Anaerolineae bacterium]|nr:dienelactone hydrolase family protein [Anaerolineae bacterium]